MEACIDGQIVDKRRCHYQETELTIKRSQEKPLEI